MDFFLKPREVAHRQYEALRAFFVESVSAREIGEQFGYTRGSVHLLCHKFRHDSAFRQTFFQERPRGPAKGSRLGHMVIALRKKNLSVYDIRRNLSKEGISLSINTIWVILKKEGFARLPRRRDDERPELLRPQIAQVADARALDLSHRSLRTQFGGLFLFLPLLSQIQLPRMLAQAGFPGSKKIGPAEAIRSLLALKLFGNARHSHIMSHVFDEGLGLFAGLNVIPKRSFLTEYSCRIRPSCYPKLMSSWFDKVGKLGLLRGVSFDLDFHTIPFYGEDALLQKHYVSKRSRRQKGILAFLVQDAETRVFCYANGQLRKGQENDEILNFVEFWKRRTGRLPEELVFDSGLTTYANLNKLNKRGIRFITLRRRSKKILRQIEQRPESAWRRIELKGLARIYRFPRIVEEKIELTGYQGPIRQLSIKDLGHEEPTLLLTNHLKSSPVTLIGRYAQRMLIENNIEDGIDFFHMDALSSAVAMKINCDLQLTLMASSLYRLLGARIGNGYQTAKSRHLFRDFVEASATVELTRSEILVRFQKRAHNPLLLAAGFAEESVRIPWLGGKTLRLLFG